MLLVLLGNGVVANVLLSKSKGHNSGWIVISAGWGFDVGIAVYATGWASGGHFNPAVTLVFLARGEIGPGASLFYAGAQIIGGVAGTMIAHVMFDLPIIEMSEKVRTGGAQWFAEFVATFGLVATILGGVRFQPSGVPWLVGLYITAAYWFTASTSFANPAVTIARALSDTFAGISPGGAPAFIVAQLVGAVAAFFLARWLFPPSRQVPD